MPLIEVNNLVKDYKLNVRKKGLLGSIHSLLVPEYKMKRAVDNLSFSIDKVKWWVLSDPTEQENPQR